MYIYTLCIYIHTYIYLSIYPFISISISIYTVTSNSADLNPWMASSRVAWFCYRGRGVLFELMKMVNTYIIYRGYLYIYEALGPLELSRREAH